jgi:hypothetical protein
MAKRPRNIDPEAQQRADMVELMGHRAFHRFLFTVMQRSGIAGVAFGTEVATSYHEGRRSLGIDILRMADDALVVRFPDGLPFAAMSLAINEAMRSQPVETTDNATAPPNEDDLDDDDTRIERR